MSQRYIDLLESVLNCIADDTDMVYQLKLIVNTQSNEHSDIIIGDLQKYKIEVYDCDFK